MSIQKIGVMALAALMFSVGFIVSAANAVDTGWKRFADWTSGGYHHCGAHRVEMIYEGPAFGLVATAQVRRRIGPDCENADTVPTLSIGVSGWTKTDDGDICATTGGFIYNSQPAASMDVPMDSLCSFDRARGFVRGRTWRSSTGEYLTAANPDVTDWLQHP